MELTYQGPLGLPVSVQFPGDGDTDPRAVVYDGEAPLVCSAEEGARMLATGEWVAAGRKGPSTVEDILADVGDDQAKAATALAAETARPTPRVTLVEKLRGIAAGTDDQTAPPDTDTNPEA